MHVFLRKTSNVLVFLLSNILSSNYVMDLFKLYYAPFPFLIVAHSLVICLPSFSQTIPHEHSIYTTEYIYIYISEQCRALYTLNIIQNTLLIVMKDRSGKSQKPRFLIFPKETTFTVSGRRSLRSVLWTSFHSFTQKKIGYFRPLDPQRIADLLLGTQVRFRALPLERSKSYCFSTRIRCNPYRYTPTCTAFSNYNGPSHP